MMNKSRSKINRGNGKLSKGKKSPEGIQVSAKNATVHGIYSKTPPLAGSDDWEIYEEIKAGLIEEFQPTLFTEKVAVEQATMALIRLGRLYKAESAMIETQQLEAERDAIAPSIALTCWDDDMRRTSPDTKERLEAIQERLKEILLDRRAVISDDSKQMRLQREERHLQNILDRSLAKLEESKKRRQNSFVTQLEAEIQPD